MATEIIKLIEEFAKSNQLLEKMNAQLGQKKDGPEFRQKLAQQRENSKNLSKKIATSLKEKAASEDKRVIAKLKTQFEAELEKCRTVIKTLEQREREILVSMSVDKGDSPLGGAMSDQDLQMQQQQQHSEFAQSEVDKIREKQEAIQQIERDVAQLNEMFHDLNYLVQEQQVGIDNIESNISAAKNETLSAHKELTEAHEYQKSNRSCLCWVLAIFLAIGIALAVYFGAFFNKK